MVIDLTSKCEILACLVRMVFECEVRREMKEVKMETEEARKLRRQLEDVVEMLKKMDRKLDRISGNVDYIMTK